MALEVFWSKRADKKFDNILDYLMLEWGERVTNSFVTEVYNFLDILSEYPNIGTIEDKEKGIRAFTIVKQVNIFYKIYNNKIVILNFFDNRQDPTRKRF